MKTDNKNASKFIEGIQKTAKFKILKFSNNEKLNQAKVKLIITLDDKQLEEEKNIKKKIFAAFVSDKTLKYLSTKDFNIVGAFIKQYPVKNIVMKIKERFKNVTKIGIVLHNKEVIKRIAGLMLYNPLVQIYEVTSNSEILYKFKLAEEQNDFILILPDSFVLNYFSFQKIIKSLINSEKPFAGYSEKFLKYNASMAFEIDYEKEGERIGKYLNFILENRKNIFRIFYPKFVKYF